MLTRRSLLILLAISTVVWLATNTGLTQSSVAEFHQILRDKAAFDETGFAALEQGESVVRSLPVEDKREVAVCGLVSLQVPAEVFLESFREGMSRKTNPAILEVGKFSSTPTLEDLDTLTVEDRDLDDMKNCVVGDCRLKLSAGMIERFHKEVNPQAPDYRDQATQVLKQMLLDYVRDYQARGDAALIEYNDKPKEIRVAEDQRSLMSASGYVSDVLRKFPQSIRDTSNSELRLVEDAIVWSKIKFGLKPVLAINHIVVYKRDKETGPQVLVASKQIYANHYFNSSLALTAFVSVPGKNPGAYLFYENRSRADGLGGAFSGLKRGIVENKAIDGLKAIMESSRISLNARASNASDSAPPLEGGHSWRRFKIGKVYMLLCLFAVTALFGMFALGNYGWKRSFSAGAQ